MSSKNDRPVRVMPPVYLLAAIVTMSILHFLLPGPPILTSWWRWLGLGPLVGGIALGGTAARLFARHQTTIKPGHASSHLMVDGPYRFSRNPIYLGMVFVLAGAALLLGSLIPWLVLPVFAALIARNVIPVEEAMLEESFGTEYRQYRERVRRWI